METAKLEKEKLVASSGTWGGQSLRHSRTQGWRKALRGALISEGSGVSRERQRGPSGREQADNKKVF